MKKLKIFVLLMLVILITACATVVPKKLSKPAFTSIKINQPKMSASSITYIGAASAIGLQFGLIGGAIAGLVDGGKATDMNQAFDELNIDLAGDLYQQIETKAKLYNVAQELNIENPTHEINLEVLTYGFEKGSGLSKVKPHLVIGLEITNLSTKKSQYISSMVGGSTSELPKKTAEDWFSDQENLKQNFARAMDLVTNQLINNLSMIDEQSESDF
ncbi:MAG: hypothetical protein OEY38_05635 [Gammaproteobacteria bacterium]|nr:hypothetical protein [Gammaproteobacteria bacterium]